MGERLALALITALVCTPVFADALPPDCQSAAVKIAAVTGVSFKASTDNRVEFDGMDSDEISLECGQKPYWVNIIAKTEFPDSNWYLFAGLVGEALTDFNFADLSKQASKCMAAAAKQTDGNFSVDAKWGRMECYSTSGFHANVSFIQRK